MKIRILKKPDNIKALGGALSIKAALKGLFLRDSHVYNGNLFDTGGTVLGGYHTNGADWELDGQFHIIGNGGTHEENANEGVLQGYDNEGTPNLVEENEVVYNDYVFSNRLKVPNRRKGKEKEMSTLAWEESILKPFEGLTYADAAKKAYKTAEERPNDVIEKRGLEVTLGVLAGSQEKERAKQLHEEAKQEIASMSGEDYIQMQEQERMALEMAALQQLAQEQQLPMSPEELAMMAQQLEQQMSPEELAMTQQQAMAQQALMQQGMQQQIAAYGGKLFAVGGNMQYTQQAYPQQLQAQQPDWALMYQQIMMQLQEAMQQYDPNSNEYAQLANWFAAGQLMQDGDNMVQFVQQYMQAMQEAQLQQGQTYGLGGNLYHEGGYFKNKKGLIIYIVLSPTSSMWNYSFVINNDGTVSYDNYITNDNVEDLIQNSTLTKLDNYKGDNAIDLIKINKEGSPIIKLKGEDFYRSGRNFNLVYNEEGKIIPRDLFNLLIQNGEYTSHLYPTTKNTPTLAVEASPDETPEEVLEVEAPLPQKMSEREAKKFRKEYEKYTRDKGIDYKKLTKALQEAYDELFKTIVERYENDRNYNYALDEELFINSLETSKRKTVQLDNLKNYQNELSYLDLITLTGGKDASDLITNGKIGYRDLPEGFTSFGKRDNNFWNNPANFTEANGIYNYVSPQRAYELTVGFKNLDELTQFYRDSLLRKYNQLDRVKKRWNSGENYSTTYTDDLRKDNLLHAHLTPDEISQWVSELESGNTKERKLAEYLRQVWNDDFTAERDTYKNSQFVKNNEKTLKNRQLDALAGIDHFPELINLKNTSTNGTAEAFFYTGDNGEVYISRPDNYKIKSTRTKTLDDGTVITEYEVERPTVAGRVFTQAANDKPVDITDYYLLHPELYESIDPLMLDADLPEEYLKDNTVWVKSKDSKKDLKGNGNDDLFPKAPLWPFLAGALTLLGGLVYNAVTPVDNSYGKALLDLSRKSGAITPTEEVPIGDYLTNRPLDRDAILNAVNSAAGAARKAIANNSLGNIGAANASFLASDNNYMNAVGNAIMLIEALNRAHEKEVVAHNAEINKFNSDLKQKNDLAFLDAQSKGNELALNGAARAYDMMNTNEQNKASAISSGISGIADALYGYAGTKYNNDVQQYGIQHLGYGPMYGAIGGKLRTRRKKGLSF